ncbi:eukaryotic translation initiation factor 3 subunit A [Thoreauomyces humboldtii]|nr:eukaryotic translation initiation factor 3 subunit A [Thoreauomyces humboldtii]
MSRFYNKPENALKRAEDLIAVSQPASALSLLHDIVMSKRSRSTPLTVLEPIMLKFVELCVTLRKGKTAKEGLHQYKNISQNITVSSIESVIKRFIEVAENQVATAQTKAEAVSADSVEDLEASETPESIILSTVSAEVDKDRTDREVVTPWLKFLWEAYRTALDILRNNARLEILYQSVANQAFQFCLKYARKTEFRRLCELLRQHLATAAKYAHQAHGINLSDPDTLQRHLDTRFVQLNAATELQLWQEAFRSIEDIHNLLSLSKKPPKPFMMANYYEKLAKIFLVGENYLFHAAAWNKLYATVRLNKNLGEDEHNRMASMVLMSALAIPIITTSKTRLDADDSKPKNARLAHLLRVNNAPTRETLLKDALSKVVYSRVRPDLKELHQILEVQFHPLSISKKIAHLLPKLSADKDMTTYIEPLHQVILTRLLQQLSQVYTTVKIDQVVKLAAFPEPYTHSAYYIEKFIMNGCKKGELSIRVNHQSQTLTFETDVFAASKNTVSDGPQLQTLPSELMRTQLTRLAQRLHTAVALIGQTSEVLPIEQRIIQVKQEAKAKAFAQAVERLEDERKENAQRRLLIEKKKELREFAQAKKDKAEAETRRIKLEADAEAEKIRVEEDAKKREADRVTQQRAEILRLEAVKLAAKMAEDLKEKNVKVGDLEGMDTTKLMQMQVEQLEKEKRDLQTKLKTISKKLDHTERAFRKEEIPLLGKDYDEQKATDLAAHEALKKAKRAAAKLQHQEALQMKGRMMRMLDDYAALKRDMSAQRDQEHAAIRVEAEKRIAKAKQQRIQEVRQRRADEVVRRREEEEQRIRDEEEELRRYDEEQRAAEEAGERADALRAEEEERQAKNDEIARKVREKEAAIEAKLAAEKASSVPASATASRPSVPGTDAWRRDAPPREDRPTPVAASGAPGKYVPPVRRTDSAGSGTAPPVRRTDSGEPASGGWRSRESVARESNSSTPADSRFGSRTSVRSEDAASAAAPSPRESWGSRPSVGPRDSTASSERPASTWKPAAPGGGGWRERQAAQEKIGGGDATPPPAAAPGANAAPRPAAGAAPQGKWRPANRG